MDKAERLALVVSLSVGVSPFLKRRFQQTQDRHASIERRADVTGSLRDAEALATSFDEQIAILGKVAEEADRGDQEIRQGLIAAGWTPGTNLAAWVGCTEDELRQAIETAQV